MQIIRKTVNIIYKELYFFARITHILILILLLFLKISFANVINLRFHFRLILSCLQNICIPLLCEGFKCGDLVEP